MQRRGWTLFMVTLAAATAQAQPAPQIERAAGLVDEANEAALLAEAARFESAGNRPGAENDYRQALALREKRLGGNDPALAEILTRLANVLRGEGKSAEAETLLRRAVAISQHAFGATDFKVATRLDDLHTVLTERGNWPEATRVAETSLQIKSQTLGAEAPDVVAAAAEVARTKVVGARAVAPPPPPAKPVSTSPAADTPGATPPVAPSDYDAVDQALAHMRDASIAFDVPAEIAAGDAQMLRLLMSLAASVDELKKALVDRVASGVEGATVKVTPTMEAHLVGQAFEITPITPELQAVSAAGTTEWQWQVSSTQAGTQSLHLALDARVSIDGSNTEYSIRQFDKTIRITVSWWRRAEDFVGNHFEWLWTVLLLPILAFVWKKFRAALRSKRQPAM
jgi:tetratricopeptide (TPR) repeat protein